MQALIINSKRNGLPAIRSLGARGVNVIAVDHFSDAIGFYSKYTTVAKIVPLITDGEEDFALAVADIGRKYQANDKIVLIPTSDAHLLAFVRQWKHLSAYFYPLFELNLDTLNRCLDKTKVIELAETSRVPIPRSIVSPSAGDRTHDLRFPIIVKPDIRSGPEAIAANIFRLRTCHTKGDVENAAAELEAKGFSFVVQEYIPGDDDTLYTVGLYANKGEVLACFTGRKLRQFPPAFGECSYGEIVSEQKIVDYALQLMSASKYTGIAQIEFKQYKGEYYLIEINPRIWSWASLSVVAGVDLVWAGYRHTVSNKKEKMMQNIWNGKWSYLREDIRSDKLRDSPTGILRILWQSLTADSHSIWSASDPLPGIVQLALDIGIKLPISSRVEPAQNPFKNRS